MTFFFGLLPLPTTHTELPQQWRFREINASNDEYYRPSSVFDSFMMRRCYGICFRWPQGNIRWVYTPPINLEIAYDNLEFQVVVRFQVVVQHMEGLDHMICRRSSSLSQSRHSVCCWGHSAWVACSCSAAWSWHLCSSSTPEIFRIEKKQLPPVALISPTVTSWYQQKGGQAWKRNHQ